jgi:hypothetical protein
VVLLASTLLNAEAGQRRAFLATCRYHLPDGVAVFQYHPPAWFEAFPNAPREGEIGAISIVIRSCRRVPSGIACELDYWTAGRIWTHAGTSYQIGDAELAADLAEAGLVFGQWLTEDHTWFTARPLGCERAIRDAGPPVSPEHHHAVTSHEH